MQIDDNGLFLCSPSDLVTFFGCAHASFLDVRALSEDISKAEADDLLRLLQEKGFEHEARYLDRLKDQGNTVVEIPKRGDLHNRAKLTLDAMRSGADVIFQAVFLSLPWRGDADFLIKCETPSDLGDYSYEVLDTKLTRTAAPRHIVQLCMYSQLLEHSQGLRPANMYLLLGDGERHEFRVQDFFYYHMRARTRFEDFLRNLPAESNPEPCKHCGYCGWRDRCTAQWESEGHLSLVANIMRSQMDKLRDADIRSLADLATTEVGTVVPDLDRAVFRRLRSQAILQLHKATTGEDTYEIIDCPSGKGFERMPTPDDGDLFFDIEGDPLYANGLEYLFGVNYFDGEATRYREFWAHDHEEEKETFISFMGFLADHLAKHPRAHIYHYNHYEVSALKRLSCRYAVCEDQVDDLLRNHRFVDLFQVVRESIRTSEPHYTLKNMEAFYMDGHIDRREDVVGTAFESIVVYNRWRETGADKLLRDLADYNEADCFSTRALRDWILELIPDDSARTEGQTNPVDDEAPSPQSPAEIQYGDFGDEYSDDFDDEYNEQRKVRLALDGDNPTPVHVRLSHLLEFHRREAKPGWWRMFDRQNKFEDELIEDAECIGGLSLIDLPLQTWKSLTYPYRFPPQEYKIKVGDRVKNTATTKFAGTVEEIDEDECTVKIKRGGKRNQLPYRFSIGPEGPVDTKVIRSAIYRHAGQIVRAPDTVFAATELLDRNVPRIQGRKPGDRIIASSALQEEAIEAVAGLNDSYLFIQGPPGAGKTHTCGHIIVELMRRGKKVGVTSNSHKAIHNLLKQVESVASKEGVEFRGVKKASSNKPETEFSGQFIGSIFQTDSMGVDRDLYAGTAWTFSHPHFHHMRLDYLFVDEAGQVPTANVVAMATAARNIVLVGDQMQLAQPIQGTHPGEAGLSVLEFLLGDRATIPATHGIFLDQTRRMRPSVCEFVSEAFYDGRLSAHESTSKRSLDLKNIGLPNEGIVMIPVPHEGCSQKSVEEGELIKARYRGLLGQMYDEVGNGARAITEDDILVVSPYNVQVNHLREILPRKARVGTVDKFQGQEAPIVLISMTTSGSEDMPRNIDFLFSKNRLNVAISRAQCLAVVFASPALLNVPCRTIRQMRLVNTFCWLEEYAKSSA